MGYGQYTGNMSVHWSVMHEDAKGQEVKLSAQDRAGLSSDRRATTSTWTRARAATTR